MSTIVGLIIYLGIGFTFLKISEARGNSYSTRERLFVACLFGPWVCITTAFVAAVTFTAIVLLGELVLNLIS